MEKVVDLLQHRYSPSGALQIKVVNKASRQIPHAKPLALAIVTSVWDTFAPFWWSCFLPISYFRKWRSQQVLSNNNRWVKRKLPVMAGSCKCQRIVRHGCNFILIILWNHCLLAAALSNHRFLARLFFQAPVALTLPLLTCKVATPSGLDPDLAGQ